MPHKKKKLTVREKRAAMAELSRYCGVIEPSAIIGLRNRLPFKDERYWQAFEQIVQALHWIGDQAYLDSQASPTKADAIVETRLPGI